MQCAQGGAWSNSSENNLVVNIIRMLMDGDQQFEGPAAVRGWASVKLISAWPRLMLVQRAWC